MTKRETFLRLLREDIIQGGKKRSFEQLEEGCKNLVGENKELLEECLMQEWVLIKLQGNKQSFQSEDLINPMAEKLRVGSRRRRVRVPAANLVGILRQSHDDEKDDESVDEEDKEKGCKPNKTGKTSSLDLQNNATNGEVEKKEEKVTAENKAKNRRKVVAANFKELGLDPPPDYCPELKNILGQEGDTDWKFVMMKNLFHSDIDFQQDRFSMPAKQIRDFDNFFNAEERQKVLETKQGLNVIVIEPDLKTTSEMRMMKWPFSKETGYSIVTTTSWKAVLKRHDHLLRENAILQVYSFRRQGKLFLVLKMLRLVDPDGQIDQQTYTGDGCGSSLASSDIFD